jgi:hypothetical protein
LTDFLLESTNLNLAVHQVGSKTGLFMTEYPSTEAAARDAELLDLGVVLGQTHAFGLIAGRCSAAQAEALRRLREDKLYKRLSETWDDFCRGYLQISKTEADRTIRLLEEFGPAYFDVSQLTRISPETYRAIAPAVQNGMLHFNGEAIPLSPEHSRKVAAAVAEMRRAIPKRITTPELQRIMQEITDSQHDFYLGERIVKLHECCIVIVKELERISSDERLSDSRMIFNSAVAAAYEGFGRLALAHSLIES